MDSIAIPIKYPLNTYVQFRLLFGVGEGKIFDLYEAKRLDQGKWEITYLVYAPTGVSHLVGEEDVIPW